MSQKVGRPKASADVKKDIRFSVRLDIKTEPGITRVLQEKQYNQRRSHTTGNKLVIR